jgi:hypothetical protein
VVSCDVGDPEGTKDFTMLSLILGTASLLLSTEGRIQFIRVAAQGQIPPTEEVVYRLLGHPQDVSTFGPPGGYIKYLDYWEHNISIAIDAKGNVRRNGVRRLDK